VDIDPLQKRMGLTPGDRRRHQRCPKAPTTIRRLDRHLETRAMPFSGIATAHHSSVTHDGVADHGAPHASPAGLLRTGCEIGPSPATFSRSIEPDAAQVRDPLVMIEDRFEVRGAEGNDPMRSHRTMVSPEPLDAA
jgi:hypothetical protein